MDMRTYEVSFYDRMQDLSLIIVEMSRCMPHVHREMELCYILDGEGIAEYGGKSIRMDRGDYIIFNMRRMHSFMSATGRPVTILRIKIAQSFGEHFYPDMNRIEFDDPCIGRASDPNVSIDDILLPLAKEYFSVQPQFQLLCMSKACELMYRLMRYFSWRVITDDEKFHQMQREQRTERILDYAEKNYMQKVSLSKLAERENISLSYLSHFVHDQLGMSFQEYIEMLRCKHAETLIDTDSNTLINICIASGFQDCRQMNKAFVKHIGISAGTYRNMVRSGELIKGKNIVDFQRGYSQYVLNNEESARTMEKY